MKTTLTGDRCYFFISLLIILISVARNLLFTSHLLREDKVAFQVNFSLLFAAMHVTALTFVYYLHMCFTYITDIIVTEVVLVYII